jgi:hypothetical protein
MFITQNTLTLEGLKMAYNSKKNIVSLVAGVLTVAAYIIYICTAKAPAQEDIAAWAKLMLVFIGIGVGAGIVVQILFHIVYAVGIAAKENDNDGAKTEKIIKASMIEDERDKLIELKTSRIGYICAGFGLMIALFTLAGGAPVVFALHIVVGATAAGSLVEGCAGIFFHERGVRNG